MSRSCKTLIGLLAVSIIMPSAAALAEPTRDLNVWGSHFQVPAGKPGGVLGYILSGETARPDRNAAIPAAPEATGTVHRGPAPTTGR